MYPMTSPSANCWIKLSGTDAFFPRSHKGSDYNLDVVKVKVKVKVKVSRVRSMKEIDQKFVFNSRVNIERCKSRKMK